MTELELISAIGAVGNQDLERCERTVCAVRHRFTTRLCVAAAVAALLSTTVFAVPAFRNAIFGADAKQVCISRIYVKEGKQADVSESSIDVSLDVRMDPNAPDKLESWYVPMLPAEQWETVPLKVSEGTNVTFDTDTLLQWKNGDGAYISFRQAAQPNYSGDCGWDSVCTGFDADYTITQTELGGYSVQRIVVEPSAKEVNGVRGEHPGLQKLYWSDGFYIISMEVNYGMSDEALASILESIQPVEDINAYVTIQWVPVERRQERSLHLKQFLIPETPPEGYVQAWCVLQPNGELSYLWHKDEPQVMTVLELSNGPDGRNEDIRRDWETFYIPDETEQRDVNGTKVICYQDDWRAQILWRFDDVDYTLKSSGPDRLSYEELLHIMESLVIVEDINSVLTK